MRTICLRSSVFAALALVKPGPAGLFCVRRPAAACGVGRPPQRLPQAEKRDELSLNSLFSFERLLGLR